MATVINKNKQKEGKSSFLVQIRYAAADSKVALQKYVAENTLTRKTPMTKKLVKEIFFRNILGNLPRKGVEALAEFLFVQALENSYIVPVPKIWSTDEQEYIIAPDIDEKRPGPRKRNDLNH